MINVVKLVGTRRAALLGVTLSINLAIAAAWFFVVEPMRVKGEMGLAGVNAQIGQLAQNTQNIKLELAAFPAKYEYYARLEKSGFFSAQDRFEAGRLIDVLREKAGLLGYQYRIDALQDMADDKAAASNLRLVRSSVTIDSISSVLDTNVFTLLRVIRDVFPQHTRIDKFEIRRVKELDEPTLRQIAQAPVQLTGASVTFDWLTIMPQDGADGTGPGGFRGR